MGIAEIDATVCVERVRGKFIALLISFLASVLPRTGSVEFISL